MTKPLLKEPKPAHPPGDWKNKKPANPDGLSPYCDWDTAMPLDDLEEMAQRHVSTWEQLTRYNWGTAKPKEVNWYLQEYCGCTLVNREGNYMFTQSVHPGIICPNEKMLCPFPEPPSPPPAPPPAVVPKTQPTVLDSPVCECKNSRCQIECKPPKLERKEVQLKIGVKASVKEEKLYAEKLDLVLSSYKIHRLIGKDYDEKSNETVTTLWIYFESVSSKIFSHLPKIVGKSSGQIKAKWGNGNLDKIIEWPQMFVSYAETLRLMQEAEVLKSLVIRGFTNRTECTNYLESKELSKRRAKWVVDQLTKNFGLLLAPQGMHGKTGMRDTKMFTPVKIIPCGRYVMPFPRSAAPDANSAVTIEFEHQAPSAQTEDYYAESGTKIHCWSVYENHASGKMMFCSSGNRNNGLAETLEMVEKFRGEALNYIHSFYSLAEASSDAEAASLASIWVRSWNSELVYTDSSFAELGEVYSEYKDKENKIEWERLEPPPPWSRAVPVTSRPFLDHQREYVYQDFGSADYDVMKVKTLQKSKEKINVDPMVIYFKVGQPTP